MNHAHSHQVSHYDYAFAIGVLLNIAFVIIEVGFGLYANSLALITDAGHNLSDVATLLLAWGASLMARKVATDKRTYGFRKLTILASLVSAVILFIALGSIAWEAIGRLSSPNPVDGMIVIIVAAIGVVINTLTALLFVKGQKQDLNIRAAFLHMAADAGVSLGVVISGAFIVFKGWLWIDPLVSLLVVAIILLSTWVLLRDSLNYAIDAVPSSVDIPSIRDYLLGLDDVADIHDLHVWPLSTTEIALTVHLVVNRCTLDNDMLCSIQQHLHDRYAIAHSTIQVESVEGESLCMLDTHK
ncbi:MAG: cation diffusion facilitator family transporter [Gammaproteobacteria bacterium]|nr:cation diffusion facilitator family transporter [Gammaproteobacteria bacterium]